MKPNAYIAAQGPNEYTINDFWRLVWEQQTFVIVMLTKVFDFIRVMCCQYWPMEEHKAEQYGDIEVTLLNEENMADFVIRMLKVRKDGVMVKRKVKRVKLVKKSEQNKANEERQRMLDEDQQEDVSASDRFREPRKSIFCNSIHPAQSITSTSGHGSADHLATPPHSRQTSLRTVVSSTGSSRIRSGKSSHKTSFQTVDEYEEVEYEEEVEEDDVRIIYQIHYNNWSSHTCPFPTSLLQFRRRVRIYMQEVLKEEGDRVGPTIVHCSDGCGRTGAYLCIDANLELADEDGLYDVYGYSKRLKHSRKGLIENIVSLFFVFQAFFVIKIFPTL